MSDPMADRCAALAPLSVPSMSPYVPLSSPLAPRRCSLYLGHEGDHTLSHGRSWPEPPWRIDVPSVPAHITCLREEQTGRLWVLRSGAWFRWNGAVVSGARLVGELFDLAPLVEYPDPRKAADHAA